MVWFQAPYSFTTIPGELNVLLEVGKFSSADNINKATN